MGSQRVMKRYICTVDRRQLFETKSFVYDDICGELVKGERFVIVDIAHGTADQPTWILVLSGLKTGWTYDRFRNFNEWAIEES